MFTFLPRDSRDVPGLHDGDAVGELSVDAVLLSLVVERRDLCRASKGHLAVSEVGPRH